MFETKNMGKTIGILFLIQITIGLFVNFSVMPELFGNPGFPVTGSEIHLKVGVSLLLSLLIGCINIVVAAVCYNAFSKTNPVLTLFFLAFTAANLAVTAIEYTAVMNMVSFSKQYLAATAQEASHLVEVLRPLLMSTRNWAHFTNVTFGGSVVFIFYLLLFRGSDIPKALAGWGMFVALIQLSTVTQPFLGGSVNTLFLVPIGLTQILMPIYFIFQGIGKASNTSKLIGSENLNTV